MSLLTDTQGTPERVWSAVCITAAEGGKISRDDLWAWLNPDFIQSGQPRQASGDAHRQTVGAASSLGLLTLEAGQYVLDGQVSTDYSAYADDVHDRLCASGREDPNFLMLETYAWLGLAADARGTEWAAASDFADHVEEALGDPTAGDGARRFNSTKQAPWRRWMRLIGLAVELPTRLGFHPNVTHRLRVELERAELPVGTPLPAAEVMTAIGRRMPYLDRGTLRADIAARCGLANDPARVSRLMSTALRDLHDDGVIELVSRGDATGYVDLSPDPFHPVQSVLTITLSGRQDD
ncbi:MAG: hypothetical protein LKF80_03550 [Brevundimonas sp.]|jgi:hypothetical protein|uniref:hypothetical protein n=1 Tax=Brevundimonas sp. TaxID=1871086 RepID=UPI0025BB9E63|nr:hypothetical protein [Brevundimonas sp.]MCH4267457.1 hypothetical protein [Brevundimonas sp.]